MLLENIGLHVLCQLESNLSQFARILIFLSENIALHGLCQFERILSQFARILIDFI
jgi:hypothetical protein